MKIIDLHEDLIETYQKNPERFFDDNSDSIKDHYNAGSYKYYKDRFDLVFGAIRPYICEGDMTDIVNRKICFSHPGIQKGIDEYNQWKDKIPFVMNKKDLESDEFKILLHLEGHDTLSSVEELKALFDQGIRSFGRTWNQDTTLSGANIGNKGLTPLGWQVMEAMNERGMIIDTAHMSWQGMKELAMNSKKPILNSHSNVDVLHHHNRNIPDDIIDLFPKNGGVIGVSIYTPFITSEPTATLDMYLDQVDHLINRIGDNHIGLGTDWHGIPRDKAVQGLDHVRGVDILEEKMIDRFGRESTEKFLYKNARRVIEDNIF